MDEEKKKDLGDVIGSETRRGRRPIDVDAKRKRLELLNDLRKLLMLATEEEFIKAMQAAGLRDGSPQFLEALRIWREYRS